MRRTRSMHTSRSSAGLTATLIRIYRLPSFLALIRPLGFRSFISPSLNAASVKPGFTNRRRRRISGCRDIGDCSRSSARPIRCIRSNVRAGVWLGGQCPLAARGEVNSENLTTKWCILKYI